MEGTPALARCGSHTRPTMMDNTIPLAKEKIVGDISDKADIFRWPLHPKISPARLNDCALTGVLHCFDEDVCRLDVSTSAHRTEGDDNWR